MNTNLVIRVVGFAAMLIITAAFNPAYAQESSAYNTGLLASESGDYDKAAAQWQPLAAKGDALAQFNLALMYHRGLGVNMDEAVAVSWYHRSATNGYSKAQEFLVAAYSEGWFGLVKDQERADYWGQQLENSSF